MQLAEFNKSNLEHLCGKKGRGESDNCLNVICCVFDLTNRTWKDLLTAWMRDWHVEEEPSRADTNHFTCISLLLLTLLDDPSALLTCVASVTAASCRYSELPHPNSCPSLDTARLQSPYVLICCTSTPARSPPTSTGLELMLLCPKPARWRRAAKSRHSPAESENRAAVWGGLKNVYIDYSCCFM